MSQSGNPNVNELFQSAQDEGLLSAAGFAALTNVHDVGQAIQASLGGDPEETVKASECVLLCLLIDDSGSIEHAGNEQALRDGHNLILDAVEQSKQTDNILVLSTSLNGRVWNNFVHVADATRLDAANYKGDGGTPLFEQSVIFAGTVLAESMKYYDAGIPVRSISVIITDGNDEHSFNHSASDVAAVVTDMLASEMPGHIVGGMGIDDKKTNFTEVFTSMGVNPGWILTPGNSEKEIRAACAVFSRSAVSASQSAGNFSKAAQQGLGGFMSN